MEKPNFKVPLNFKANLVYLKEWISQQPYLNARTDDEWLYIFLRGCKYSSQRTKEKIENFFTIKTALPHFFEDRDPLRTNIQEILKLGLFVPLPVNEEHQTRYFFHQCKLADPDKVRFTDVIKVFLMIADVVFMEDVNKDIEKQFVLCDLEGLSMKHLIQVTPSLSKQLITFLRKGYPGRLKGFYFVNAPLIFENTLNVVKPLLGRKISNRIKIYSSNDGFKGNDIPLTVLPRDYGGKGKSISELGVEWKLKVESYREWFLDDRKYGCNETKRVGSLYSNLLEMEGSFKQLEID